MPDYGCLRFWHNQINESIWAPNYWKYGRSRSQRCELVDLGISLIVKSVLFANVHMINPAYSPPLPQMCSQERSFPSSPSSKTTPLCLRCPRPTSFRRRPTSTPSMREWRKPRVLWWQWFVAARLERSAGWRGPAIPSRSPWCNRPFCTVPSSKWSTC